MRSRSACARAARDFSASTCRPRKSFIAAFPNGGSGTKDSRRDCALLARRLHSMTTLYTRSHSVHMTPHHTLDRPRKLRKAVGLHASSEKNKRSPFAANVLFIQLPHSKLISVGEAEAGSAGAQAAEEYPTGNLLCSRKSEAAPALSAESL